MREGEILRQRQESSEYKESTSFTQILMHSLESTSFTQLLMHSSKYIMHRQERSYY